MENMDIDTMLRQGVERRASDVHITVGLPPMTRVYGAIQALEGYERLTPEDTFQLSYSMLNSFQKQRFEKTWELDFSYGVTDVGRFRVNMYRQRGSIGIACRVIPTVIPFMEDLHLPAKLKDLCRLPRGLVLVTGPTGQGKSTTLAAMIDFINNDRQAHIVTIEDPIEYLHNHKKSIINQRELGIDTHSFPDAMRAVLREDPNVIMVGEMRDLETIAAALTITETGHLVFATLHTANAAQSIDRIIDVFPPYQQQQIRVQLGSAIEAIVSQQLLPNMRFAETRQRRPVAVTARGGAGAAPSQQQRWRSEEVGRVPAVELMIATAAIRNLIREQKSHQIQSAIQTGSQYGMQTMDQALAALYGQGFITMEQALAKAIYPDELRSIVERGEARGAG